MQLVTIEMSNHAVLRNPADRVDFPLDAKTKLLLTEMLQFFNTLESPNGKPAGLAATQVGIPLRFIIIQVPPEAKAIRNDVFDVLPPTILINPSYTPVLADGKNKDWEGCYSVPNKMGEVYRFNTIHYDAYTLDGKKIMNVARGFLARLLQHEIGHMNGELYIDLLEPDCRYGTIDEMMVIRKREFEAMGESAI